MKLVVVESPSKAKTIKKYLGKGYKVLASRGHVVDLPKSKLAIDVEHNFKPEYEVTNNKSFKEIKSAFKDADKLVLAVDRDREGEAIGWHIAKELKMVDNKGRKINKSKDIERIVFTEITKEAILNAINNPHQLNMDLVDAQQARRVLDRLVGYKLSPLLWKKIRFGLSAGRVQSAALKIIIDRELERNKFESEEYWKILAYLAEKSSDEKRQKRIIKSEDEKTEIDSNYLQFELKKLNGENFKSGEQKLTESLIDKFLSADWTISDIVEKDRRRNPNPPFITSTLQRSAANRLGYSSKQTMAIAQKLYEKGYITYMRTDSTALSDQAISAIRNLIKSNYGNDYLPPVAVSSGKKSKLAQEAHEAIRPTDVKQNINNLDLDEKEAKLYQLIWNRAVASQMQSCLLKTVQVSVEPNNSLFQANGQRIEFPGYTKVYPEAISEMILPPLKVGQKLYLGELIGSQHFTSPPARYTEASLIKALESFGIGRPSTYAPTISTLLARKYIEKEQKSLVPTDTGMVVNKLLDQHFHDIVDAEFTASLENKLDDIAQGKRDWIDMLREFYEPFALNLEKKEKEIQREDFTVLEGSDEKCHLCGKKMIVKLGRYGRFLSCSNFPECKGIKNIDGLTEEEVAQQAKTEDFLSKYKSSPMTDDGREYLLKNGRYGRFWAHPDYPKVKDARPLEYTDKIFMQIYGKAPKTKDNKKMILRRGRFGEFWAHPNYPDKKEVVRINKKEVEAKKQELQVD